MKWYKAKNGAYVQAVRVEEDNGAEIDRFIGDDAGSTRLALNLNEYLVRGNKLPLSVVSKDLFEFAFEETSPPKRAMLSQPMNGLSDEEIVETRDRAIKYLESQGYEVVNTLFTDEWYNKEAMEERGVKQIPVCFLAKSIENMSLCDVVFFCTGWERARGCTIEHEIAERYGLTIIHETEVTKNG